MAERTIIVSADELALSIVGNEVLLVFRSAPASLGLIDVDLGLRLAASEARQLARALERKAAEAEGAASPPSGED